MSTNLESTIDPELARERLAAGIAAAKGGSKGQAQAALEEALELDPQLEDGWLWLATLLKERAEQRRCLERVLAINPAHQHARALLQRAEFREEPEVPQARCLLCGAGREPRAGRCPRCRAVLSFDDLGALVDNPEVDAELVEGAIRTRQGLVRWGGGVELHQALALAHLNLGQVGEGLHHLKALSLLRPSDELLRSRIAILARPAAGAEDAQGMDDPGGGAGPAAEPDDPEETAAAAGNEGAGAEPGPALPRGKATVLVVDASATGRKLVASSLEAHGLAVVAAGDAAEGLARLGERGIDLVVVDVDLPESDGFALCRSIKADAGTAALPVLLLSGRAGYFDRRRGRKAGAAGHLRKPFEPRALVDQIRRHLPP